LRGETRAALFFFLHPNSLKDCRFSFVFFCLTVCLSVYLSVCLAYFVSPRQLHNTHWGYICPAETPEGGAVGLVKNMALMAYISVGSSSGMPALVALKFICFQRFWHTTRFLASFLACVVDLDLANMTSADPRLP
jgi:hypothetical protein